MKGLLHIKKMEKGQILPIVVIGLVVLIGFAALILDGGALFLNRRTAQAAADAGALAGAHEICYATGADPLVVAVNYAEANFTNTASSATAQYVGSKVQVTATVVNESFFAKVFGEDTLTATAQATAGCFPPEGNYLMPIAWSCRPPVGGGSGVWDPELGCKMMALDWIEELKPLVEGAVSTTTFPHNPGAYFEMDGDSVVDTVTGDPPAQIYIVMDMISTSEETLCKEDLEEDDPFYETAIWCDLNFDGKNDIEGEGSRGWLDLDGGGGGTSSLRDWIQNGLDFTISPHTWISHEPGNIPPVYEDIETYHQGKIVWIPIFNAICGDSDPLNNVECMEAAHAYPFDPEPPTGDIDHYGPAPKYHIVTFAPFYVSCVHIKSHDYCPGFDLAQRMNPNPKNLKKSRIGDNVPSIEGFFLTNVDKALDTSQDCDVNLGNCVVSLD